MTYAAARIAAAYSGIAPLRVRGRHFVALQAFIDDSVTSGKVLVLAGYIASVDEWTSFSAEWQERLDMLPRWKSFKMASVAQSNDTARLERAGWFYRVIEDHARVFVAIAVEIEPLERIVCSLNLPSKYKNPYFLAFRAIVDFTAQYQHEMGLTEPIDFYFDDRSEKESVRKGFELFKASRSDDIKKLIGHEPRFEDDEEFLPLQAGDLLAWHVRKLWLQTGNIAGEQPIEVSWPSNRKDGLFPGYAFNLGYDELLANLTIVKARLVALGYYGAPFNSIGVSFAHYIDSKKEPGKSRAQVLPKEKRPSGTSASTDVPAISACGGSLSQKILMLEEVSYLLDTPFDDRSDSLH